MEYTHVKWIAGAVRHRWVMVVLVFLVIVATDSALTWLTPRTYLARTSLLIGPSSTEDPGQLVYSVDALGRSMIVGTYANVLETDLIQREALEQVGVNRDPADTSIEVKAAALADSAVVQVTATAPDPNIAAAVANAVGQVGQLRMRELYPMYNLTVVTPAAPPTRIYRPEIRRNAAVGLLLALLLGVGSACAIEWWSSAPREAR